MGSWFGREERRGAAGVGDRADKDEGEEEGDERCRAPCVLDCTGLPESVPLQCLKRTYQPGLRSRKRKHGYLGRMDTANGRRVLRSRRRKGRHQLSI